MDLASICVIQLICRSGKCLIGPTHVHICQTYCLTDRKEISTALQGTEMFNFAHNRNIHLLKFLNLLFVTSNIIYTLFIFNTLHIYNYQGERTRNPTNAGRKKLHIKNVIQLEISKNENSRKIREIILTKRE